MESEPNTENSTDPVKVAKFACNCRYPWLRELHGLSTLMMSNSIDEKVFWTAIIIVCGTASVFFADSIMEEFMENQFSTRITIIPVKKLKYPTLVFCPKNGDNIHLEPLLRG
ncbi:unnamed protein product [Heligmosomoides polygyrus]|uniref:Uncharacterized protein n=1 Tax=Heligmosomoides polygyrus TaxID=6339 RepID=A0A3P7TCM7_HELPZ|nr:unnamed protein product [Heligmosomoides polygyrus]